MSKATPTRLAELFEAAIDQPPDARERFIREHCSDHPDLEAALRDLLARDAANHTLADVLQPDGADVFNAAPVAGLAEGLIIGGRFHIVRLLGHGGMGAVYLAQQQQPRRMVAIKIIRSAFASRHLQRRFEFEAAVLAKLNHPTIAQIYETGFHDDGAGGLPYFVMEYVEGVPLSTFLRDHEPSIADRLRLFVQICEGVHHAHLRGVVHRDLKPANIMVVAPAHVDPPTGDTSITHTAYPKILDFGIARTTDSDITLASAETSTGQIIGTLAYMSPEQVNGRSDQVDVRSDVYSLGVILYEVLAGRHPIDLSDATLARAAQVIAETDPPALGTVHRELRGDLSTIVAKAMEKSPDRRYASAAELAEDIERSLSNEPIRARPATRLYQLSKFTRRNRAVVLGALMTFIVLIAGIVGTTFGMLQARDEAARARAVTDFMNDTLTKPTPERSGTDVRFVDILSDAADEVDTRFADHPEEQSSVHRMIAQAFEALSHLDGAAASYEQAVAVGREHFGPASRTTLIVQADLAEVYYFQSRFAEAEAVALDILEHVPAHERATTDYALNARRLIGIVRAIREDYDNAIPELATVIDDTKAALPEGHHLISVAELSLAMALYRRAINYQSPDHIADLERSADLLRDVVQREERFGRARSLNHLNTLLDLAEVNEELDRFDEVAEALNAFDTLAAGKLNEDHVFYTRALRVRALLHEHRHEWQQAAEDIVQAIELARRRSGDLAPTTLTQMSSGLRLIEPGGAFEVGETYAATLFRVMGGHGAPPELYEVYLARFISGQGRFAEAQEYFDSLGAREAVADRSWLNSLYNLFLGEHLLAQGDAASAHWHFLQAKERAAEWPDHHEVPRLARIDDAIARAEIAMREE